MGGRRARQAPLGGLLGDERCARIGLVSADAAEWIGEITERCGKATLCLDAAPHIVAGATKALDVVAPPGLERRPAIRATRRGRPARGCRYALWRSNADLTGRQMVRLAWVAAHNGRLYRAYELNWITDRRSCEPASRSRARPAWSCLHAWLRWAARRRIHSFVALGKRIRKNTAGIEASASSTAGATAPRYPAGTAEPTHGWLRRAGERARREGSEATTAAGIFDATPFRARDTVAVSAPGATPGA